MSVCLLFVSNYKRIQEITRGNMDLQRSREGEIIEDDKIFEDSDESVLNHRETIGRREYLMEDEAEKIDDYLEEEGKLLVLFMEGEEIPRYLYTDNIDNRALLRRLITGRLESKKYGPGTIDFLPRPYRSAMLIKPNRGNNYKTQLDDMINTDHPLEVPKNYMIHTLRQCGVRERHLRQISANYDLTKPVPKKVFYDISEIIGKTVKISRYYYSSVGERKIYAGSYSRGDPDGEISIALTEGHCKVQEEMDVGDMLCFVWREHRWQISAPGPDMM